VKPGAVLILALALLAAPLATGAHTAGKVPSIGIVGVASAPDTGSDALRPALRDLG
jgi:hypothetical protein